MTEKRTNIAWPLSSEDNDVYDAKDRYFCRCQDSDVAAELVIVANRGQLMAVYSRPSEQDEIKRLQTELNEANNEAAFAQDELGKMQQLFCGATERENKLREQSNSQVTLIGDMYQALDGPHLNVAGDELAAAKFVGNEVKRLRADLADAELRMAGLRELEAKLCADLELRERTINRTYTELQEARAEIAAAGELASQRQPFDTLAECQRLLRELDYMVRIYAYEWEMLGCDGLGGRRRIDEGVDVGSLIQTLRAELARRKPVEPTLESDILRIRKFITKGAHGSDDVEALQRIETALAAKESKHDSSN